MKMLQKYTLLTKHTKNKNPTFGKKKDPAHPAIYPTGEQRKLKPLEKKVYDLIVKRFISCFCKPALIENKRIVVDVNGLKFSINGAKIKEKNWMNVYPTSQKEADIPTVEGEVDITEIRTEEKMTTPPKRFSAASLVKELEKRNLGTKATRAGIVETLFTRGYAKEKSIQVTELGMQMAKTLEKFCPVILDEKLTAQFEEEMEKIEDSKGNYEKLEKNLLENAKKTVINIAQRFTKDLAKIGESLKDANEKVWEEEKEQNTMSVCPVCEKGKLRVMYGRKFKRYFVSCDAYPDCKTTFSLPPRGVMKPARDKDGELNYCEECNFPLITSLKKGRAPWKFCFNPECPTNEELQKKKKEFKKKLESGEIKIDKDGKIIDSTKSKKSKKSKNTRKKLKKK